MEKQSSAGNVEQNELVDTSADQTTNEQNRDEPKSGDSRNQSETGQTAEEPESSGSIDEPADTDASESADGETPEESPSPGSTKNPAAVSLGRLGGLKGGKARARNLTAEERREAARKAATARWQKKKATK